MDPAGLEAAFPAPSYRGNQREALREIRSALRTVIQACGRVVRAPDDHGATYLADESLLDLFERARGELPDWFRAQVDRMRRPDLPAFAPAAALEGASGRTRSKRGRSNAARDADGGHPLSDVWDVE